MNLYLCTTTNCHVFLIFIHLSLGDQSANSKSLPGDVTNDDVIISKLGGNTDRKHLVTKPWTDAIVPYLLDDKFLAGDRAKIGNSMALIEKRTCVRFIPRTTEKNYAMLTKDFRSSRDCNSVAGMIGEKQIVNLTPKCITRSTTHELMHVIGFAHEHNRPNRDNYIVVHYENIKEGYEVLFNKIEGVYANMFGAYDIQSITHYGNTDSPKNGQHTIDPKDGAGRVGQRWRLTELDFEKVNNFYECDNKRSLNISGPSDDFANPGHSPSS